MSMASNGGPAATPPAAPPGGAAQPSLGVVAQYVKDFSFENPNAPRSLQTQVQPQIGIQINVNANALGGTAPNLQPTDFEVELRLEGKAEGAGSVLFSFELVFAGVFRVQNVPPDTLQPLVMIECPRLLFPFAREIIASATRNGGFPPLLLDPIDFVALYQQRVAQAQAQGQPTPPPTVS
jgi:preprotein translocase subunit SecB